MCLVVAQGSWPNSCGRAAACMKLAVSDRESSGQLASYHDYSASSYNIKTLSPHFSHGHSHVPSYKPLAPSVTIVTSEQLVSVSE